MPGQIFFSNQGPAVAGYYIIYFSDFCIQDYQYLYQPSCEISYEFETDLKKYLKWIFRHVYIIIYSNGGCNESD